jgi:hypothetical protein
MQLAFVVFPLGMFSVVGSSVEETSAFYNKWNEEVKKTVPANRLLVNSCFKL